MQKSTDTTASDLQRHLSPENETSFADVIDFVLQREKSSDAIFGQ